MQKGGSFLTEQVTEEAIFTPEDFTEEHQMIAEMTSEFVQKRVLPHLHIIFFLPFYIHLIFI